MIKLSASSLSVDATPSAVYALWASPSAWHAWDPDVRSAQLDGDSPRVGATGRIVPASGPSARFVVVEAEQGRRFVNESRLPGARMVFDHLVEPEGLGSIATVTVGVRGPLAALWALLLHRSLRHAADRNAAGMAAYLGRASV